MCSFNSLLLSTGNAASCGTLDRLLMSNTQTQKQHSDSTATDCDTRSGKYVFVWALWKLQHHLTFSQLIAIISSQKWKETEEKQSILIMIHQTNTHLSLITLVCFCPSSGVELLQL